MPQRHLRPVLVGIAATELIGWLIVNWLHASFSSGLAPGVAGAWRPVVAFAVVGAVIGFLVGHKFRRPRMRSSAYSEVDGVIAAWVKSTKATLFDEWADSPARFFYIPGDPPFECFQVSVSEPIDGRTKVSARAVDTNDDTEDEWDETWEGSISELDAMLRQAVARIDKWKARERVQPDPPSPW